MIAQTTTCGYTGSLSKNLAVIPPRQSAAFFMPACRQSYPSLVGVENSHTTPARGKLCAAPKLPRVRPTARIEGGLSLKNLEVSMTVLAFRDVTFDVRTIRNTTYITSTQLAQALGYSREDAVGRIYERNADEFTSDMSQTVKLTVSGNYQKTVRLFSLRGAHLVAMFARTPIAKEFRKWVLDVLEKETKADINLSDPDYIVRTRQIALQYFDDFRKAVRDGTDTPTMDIPADVLTGMLAGSLWRHRFVLDVSCEGRMQISPMPDPFDTVAKIIADPGWVNLEKIKQVFDACMTALSNRLGVGGTK